MKNKIDQYKEQEVSFKKDVELDANLVLRGMKGGIDAIMNYGLRRNDIFTTTKMVTDRCEWLKNQSEEYITKVSERAAELEQKIKN